MHISFYRISLFITKIISLIKVYGHRIIGEKYKNSSIGNINSMPYIYNLGKFYRHKLI